MDNKDIDVQKNLENDSVKSKDLYTETEPEKLSMKIMKRIKSVISLNPYDYVLLYKQHRDLKKLQKERLKENVRNKVGDVLSTNVTEAEFDEDFAQYEANPEALGIVLQTILSNWTKGKQETKDVAKYELFLRKSFELGRLNGGPENDSRWYFLILGVKYGILSQEVFARFNEELLMTMPYFDFFSDVTSWKKDGRIVPEGTEGAHDGVWTYQDYVAWADMLDKGTSGKFSTKDAQKNTKEFFYEIMLQSDAARARVERVARNEQGTTALDHDDAQLFAAGLTLESITEMFGKTKEGIEKYSRDFWLNVMLGYGPYFKGIEKYIRAGDKEYGPTNSKWKKMRSRNLEEFADKFKAIEKIESRFKGALGLDIHGILKEGERILKQLA